MMDNIVSFTTAHALPATASFIASFFGAWLAARFALYRFYREKVWERKIAAYTAIFEALHDKGRWYEAHIEEAMSGSDLPKETRDALAADYRKAKPTCSVV